MFVPPFWRSNPLSKGPLQQGILLLQLLNPANSTWLISKKRPDRFELGNYEGLKVAMCINIMQYICMYYAIYFFLLCVCVCVHAWRRQWNEIFFCIIRIIYTNKNSLGKIYFLKTPHASGHVLLACAFTKASSPAAPVEEMTKVTCGKLTYCWWIIPIVNRKYIDSFRVQIPVLW